MFSYILRLIIKTCVFLILLLPLFVTHNTLYPFIFSKIIFFRIIVEIGFTAWIFLMIVDKSIIHILRKQITITLISLFIISLLASIFGADMYRSLWSTQERMTGIVTTIHFLAMFLIVSTSIRDRKNLMYIIVVNLIVSIIIALYGFIQFSNSLNERISSTLGNPIYLGIYAMMNVYLSSIAYYLYRKKVSITIVSIIGGIINLLTMFLTGGRGVLTAFFVSFIFFLMGYFLYVKYYLKKYVITAILTISLVGIVLFAINFTAKDWVIKHLPLAIHRVIILDWDFQSRIDVWFISLQGIQDRWLLGWGPENFNYLFQKYYSKPISGDGTTYFDRSHNQLIDILALTGIVGLIAYLALWAALYWMIIRAFRRASGQKRIVLLLFAGAFLAYFLQNLTVFDTPVPLIMFYFFLAFTYFICNEEEYDAEQVPVISHKVNYFHAVPIGILTVALVSYVMYEFNIKPYHASAETVRGIMFSQSNILRSMEHFRKALSMNTFADYENRLQLAKYVLTPIQQGNATLETKREFVDFAVSEMQKNIQEHPNDVKSYYALSALYRLASDYDISALDKSVAVIMRAAELAPMRPETFTEIMQVYVQKKDIEKSKEWAVKVAQYVGRGEAHYQLAQLYVRMGDYAPMLTEMQAATSEGYDIYANPSVFSYLAKTIDRRDITPDITAFIDAAVNAYPNNGDFLGSRILIHYKAGDKERAQKYLDEVRTQNPPFAKALEEYLKKIP